MAKARIISITNQKGGVGKTTTTTNLAITLALSGFKVLMIDLDPQRNASKTLGLVHPNEAKYTVFDLFFRANMGPSTFINETATRFPENLKLIYGSLSLSLGDGAFMEYAVKNTVNMYDLLRRRLSNDPIWTDYDFVLYDTPPTLSAITQNALRSATHILIPLESGDEYSLDGMEQLENALTHAIESDNPELAWLGVVITKHDPRYNVCQGMSAAIRSAYKNDVFKTMIGRSVEVMSGLTEKGMPIVLYNKHNKVAKDYWKLTNEILKRLDLTKPAPIVEEISNG
ncbi:ParA family protein [Acinetobacter sp.]|uniref:ParA family protein n=1 Tax=Acinetobacter sp. TaxID=472 RepID=UPI003D08DD04